MEDIYQNRPEQIFPGADKMDLGITDPQGSKPVL